MTALRSVAVFCGSRLGNDPRFAQAARDLGAGLARGGYRLVYGGGRLGLMGLLADAALAEGGAVFGAIPDFLTRLEVAHAGVTELAITATMHERKYRLYGEADVFVGLPGGIGTLDEMIEVITWRALGQHQKPILLCDIAGSSAPLVAAIDGAVTRGFSRPEVKSLFEVTHGVPATLARIAGLAREKDGQGALPPGPPLGP